MKKVLVMVMCAVMCCLLLVGCGDSKYVGTWKADFSGISMEITLKKDHTATMNMMGMESDEDEAAKWEVKDKKIVLSDASGEDDETLEFEIKDSKTISLTEGGVSVDFVKQ